MSLSLPGGWLESGHGAISIYVKDFRDPLERKKKLVLLPWVTIKDIKDQLKVVFNVPTTAQHLYFKGRELKNIHNLQECGIYYDNSVIDFVARRQQHLSMMYNNERDLDSPISINTKLDVSTTDLNMRGNLKNGKPVFDIHPFGAHLMPVVLMKIMHQALQGLALGLAPVLAMDGTGGTYFFKDPLHRNVGCFKPQDEEPFGPQNPRGLIGELGQNGLRRGILSGEACERELAAYLLDKDHFAGVPATSLVEARHPVFNYGDTTGKTSFKMGSLQEYVRHEDVASDLAPSKFSTRQVHKIVLLDMRLLNTDRNDANILVRKVRSVKSSPYAGTGGGSYEYELIPIDHGYCLPHCLEIAWCDWCWFNWPQLNEPLSPEHRSYILSLDYTKEAEALQKKLPIRRACIRAFIVANMIVQKGVRENLLLFDIAQIMCRNDLDIPSELEKMTINAYHRIVEKRNSSSSLVASQMTADKSCNSAGARANENFRPPVIEIPTNSPHDNLGSDFAEIPSGLRSPPGFWASYTPFSSAKLNWADDRDFEDEMDKSFSTNWDSIAATALENAACRSSVATDHTNTAYPKKANQDERFEDGPPSPTISIPGDDSDEFEILNNALDDNLQEEKLFFSLLGKLMDEAIEVIKHKKISTS